MEENEGVGASEPVQEVVTVVPKRRWVGPFVGGVVVGGLLLSVVWGLSQPKGPGPGLLFQAATGDGNTNSGGASSATFTMLGTFKLYGTSIGSGSTCRGSGGYSDIADGASVTVYDAAGKVDAVGAITKPYSLDVPGCSFSIVVPDVPSGEKFYQVEVTHRGKITVPADEAKAGKVSLTLGN